MFANPKEAEDAITELITLMRPVIEQQKFGTRFSIARPVLKPQPLIPAPTSLAPQPLSSPPNETTAPYNKRKSPATQEDEDIKADLLAARQLKQEALQHMGKRKPVPKKPLLNDTNNNADGDDADTEIEDAAPRPKAPISDTDKENIKPKPSPVPKKRVRAPMKKARRLTPIWMRNYRPTLRSPTPEISPKDVSKLALPPPPPVPLLELPKYITHTSSLSQTGFTPPITNATPLLSWKFQDILEETLVCIAGIKECERSWDRGNGEVDEWTEIAVKRAVDEASRSAMRLTEELAALVKAGEGGGGGEREWVEIGVERACEGIVVGVMSGEMWTGCAWGGIVGG
ncbi:hypothetical protein CC80DRAFT_563824 [Byssothecium circinans]|uniref:Uncharacterized protein n=1 Tax=Byssothecium circinans TaxID=147558 RepID=A0A6A5TSM6_9PLEO|nr:hypothetical protein CC80DRAFT_563824 [Byssothecium circinans]